MDYSRTTELQEVKKERDRWYGEAQDRAIRINVLAHKLKTANETIEACSKRNETDIDRIAELEAQLKEAHEGWDQDDEQHQKQLERVRGLMQDPDAKVFVRVKALKAAIKGEKA